MRKFDPQSDFKRYVLSSIDPTTPPAVRKTEIVAGGNWQVATPSEVSLNATGITPRLALNTLVPSALIGCWTCAPNLNFATRNGLSELTLA
jgi:hypothetical protein